MIAEIAALITAVGGLSSLVEKSAAAISEIGGGPFGGARKRAQAAADGLAQLTKDLASVGALARFAESYVRLHQDLVELLDVAERLDRTVEDSRPILDSVGDPNRKSKWDIVTELNSIMTDDAAAVVRRVIRGDEEYFDAADRGAIQAELGDVNSKLVRIDELISARNTSDLKRELLSVVSTVRNTTERTQATLSRILAALRNVGSPPHA